jgi:hypothetical protein
MIQVVDPRKKLCIPIPSHAVVWLGLVPLSPSPLPPGPSPPSLLTIPPLAELSGNIREADLFD